MTDASATAGPAAPASVARPARVLRALWIELRPQHWVKNLFVFTPLFFSGRVTAPDAILATVWAAILFCLTSSSIYLLNDLMDRQQDQRHPAKRHRPIASGALDPRIAWAALIGLAVAALVGAWQLDAIVAMILGGYWGVNVLYSVWLKHVVILDVFVLAAGYLLRVIGGAAAIDNAVSSWLLMCTTLLALFIGFCKRRYEIVLLEQDAHDHRQVLSDYSVPFLDMMIGIVTAAALMGYALYTVSEEAVARCGVPGLLITLPCVLYGLFRYLYLVYHKCEGGDPTQSLLSDRPMQVNLLLWVLTAGLLLYGWW